MEGESENTLRTLKAWLRSKIVVPRRKKYTVECPGAMLDDTLLQLAYTTEEPARVLFVCGDAVRTRRVAFLFCRDIEYRRAPPCSVPVSLTTKDSMSRIEAAKKRVASLTHAFVVFSVEAELLQRNHFKPFLQNWKPNLIFSLSSTELQTSGSEFLETIEGCAMVEVLSACCHSPDSRLTLRDLAAQHEIPQYRVIITTDIADRESIGFSGVVYGDHASHSRIQSQIRDAIHNKGFEPHQVEVLSDDASLYDLQTISARLEEAETKGVFFWVVSVPSNAPYIQYARDVVWDLDSTQETNTADVLDSFCGSLKARERVIRLASNSYQHRTPREFLYRILRRLAERDSLLLLDLCKELGTIVNTKLDSSEPSRYTPPSSVLDPSRSVYKTKCFEEPVKESVSEECSRENKNTHLTETKPLRSTRQNTCSWMTFSLAVTFLIGLYVLFGTVLTFISVLLVGFVYYEAMSSSFTSVITKPLSPTTSEVCSHDVKRLVTTSKTDPLFLKSFGESEYMYKEKITAKSNITLEESATLEKKDWSLPVANSKVRGKGIEETIRDLCVRAVQNVYTQQENLKALSAFLESGYTLYTYTKVFPPHPGTDRTRGGLELGPWLCKEKFGPEASRICNVFDLDEWPPKRKKKTFDERKAQWDAFLHQWGAEPELSGSSDEASLARWAKRNKNKLY